MNREERIEQWKQRIEECHNSGLSQKAWCNQNQLSLSTFRYWNRRIKEEEAELEIPMDPVFARLPSESETVLTENTIPPVVLSMHGIRIELYPSCSREMMYHLMSAIRSNV